MKEISSFEEMLKRSVLNKYPREDYDRNFSHFHCWQQGKSPACGQLLENHVQCCLCDTKKPLL